ncbi:MAG: hypothetical protein ABI543_14655 [Ignavibacteria bacterium]
MKWRMPSASQTVIIILIFVIPIAIASLIYDKIPNYLRIILGVIWFISAYAVYIYILSHGKGKEKNTITSADALKGEFAINNNWIVYSCIYPFAASIGSLINGYYIIAFMLLLTGFMLITVGKYFRKRIRIDDNDNLYIVQKGEERLIDFNTVKSIECRLKRMQTEAVYIPNIWINFRENITMQKPVKLKINILRSIEYGTYSPNQIILSFIKEKCISHGFTISYLNPEETDFTAEKF